MSKKAMVFNFSYMVAYAEHFLELGQEGSEAHNCTSMLYASFALESYVNHIGEIIEPGWNKKFKRKRM